MRFLTSALAATIAVTLISGCSGNSTAPSASGAFPPLSSQSQLARSQAVERPAMRANPSITQNLYVADRAGNAVTVYSSTGTYLHAITKDVSAPNAIAFDSAQNLYVANGNNTVTVYAPGKTAPFRTISNGISVPMAVAIGPAGYIYVANENGNSVTIYDARGLVQTLFVQAPTALAFDSQGILYVADAHTNGCDGGCYSPGFVTVCSGLPPGRTCPTVITARLDNPTALAVDKFDNLFVADMTSSSVPKFLPYPQSNKYSGATYGKGKLSSPNALVFDSFGHLCASSPRNTKVYCWNNPSSIFRTLTAQNGLDNPDSLAIGPAGWLNVANNDVKSSVTQYCPQANGCPPRVTITQSVSGPVSIAFGP
jgi:hypothetical protein